MAVQSLTRAFDIVELLAQEQHGLSLSEIAGRLQLPTSTVFRLLSAMKERGYVEQQKRSSGYRLGLTFVDMSSLYLNRLELKTEAEPFMRDLSNRTGQTVFLAIRDQEQIVYIDKMEQFSSLRKYSIIGQRRPAYTTSLGKALLLDLDDEEIRSLMAGHTFEKYGPKTHTDLQRLLVDIQSSRSRGWTMDDEEAEEGIRCVAAPIHDYRSRVIAAISVSWAISAYPDIDIQATAEQVIRTSGEISRHMGFPPPETE
jgi:IclR family KDG regulon transcriptional repressor